MILPLLLSLLAAAPHNPARAAGQRWYQLGAKAYALGDFEAALTDFDKAYQADPAPGLLFNLGQCHHQLHHRDQAAFFFKRYLEKAPAAKNAGLVRSLIQEDEAADRPRGAAPAAPAVPVVVVEAQPAPPAPPPDLAPPPPASAVPAAAIAEPAPPRRSHAPWIAAGSGAAFLLAGGVVGGLGVFNGDQTRSAIVSGQPVTEHSVTIAQANQANTEASVGLGLAAVGATVAVASLIWALAAHP